MTDFRALLNEEQYDAVTAPDGPVLVLAAAGTGKTRTLVYRVAYLVERGQAPGGILLLTFTNRAAREMLERARLAVGGAVGGVWGGTFHHVANRMLRRFGNRLGYDPDYVILDRDDSRSMVTQCVKSLGLNSKDFPKRDLLLSWFGKAANQALPIEDVLDEWVDECDVDPGKIVDVHRAYEERKKRSNAMDFDDMLVNGLQLLREEPDVLSAYQSQFQHLLVDEYQDTNCLQAGMVDLLAARHRNLMVVGDDFQCIYSWRGADFRNIMSFPERYEDVRIVKLEQNYRSVPEVLQLANACIAGNPEQFQKTLRPTRESYHRPRMMVVREGMDQARGVVEMIQRLRRSGYKSEDIAVLYRAHFHSVDLQVALTRSRMPFRITSGVGVFEQAHVKDALSFLRVAEMPRDWVGFSRLLSLLHGMGPKSIESTWKKIGESFDSRDPEQRDALVKAMRPSARPQWAPIGALLAEYHKSGSSMTGADAVERFLDVFYEDYIHRTYENYDRRLDDLRELEVQMSERTDVISFLSEVALLTNIDHEYAQQHEGDRARVHLSTVHQAKGLEWPVVIILWVVEGMFPSARSLSEGENDSEERRLFYVAVTRAMDELILCVPEYRRTRDGGFIPCENSRFIDEVSPDLMHMFHA